MNNYENIENKLKKYFSVQILDADKPIKSFPEKYNEDMLTMAEQINELKEIILILIGGLNKYSENIKEIKDSITASDTNKYEKIEAEVKTLFEKRFGFSNDSEDLKQDTPKCC